MLRWTALKFVAAPRKGTVSDPGFSSRSLIRDKGFFVSKITYTHSGWLFWMHCVLCHEYLCATCSHARACAHAVFFDVFVSCFHVESKFVFLLNGSLPSPRLLRQLRGHNSPCQIFECRGSGATFAPQILKSMVEIRILSLSKCTSPVEVEKRDPKPRFF